MPVELSSVRIYISQDQLSNLLILLPQFGNVQMKSIQNLDSETIPTGKAIIRTEMLDKLKKEIEEISQNINYIFDYFNITTAPAYFSEDQKVKFEGRDMIDLIDQIDGLTNHYHDRIAKATNRLATIDKDIERLSMERYALKMLEKYDFRTDSLDKFLHFNFYINSIFTENISRLKQLLQESQVPVIFHSEQISPVRSVFFIIALKKQDELVQKFLNIQNAERIDIPFEFITMDGINIEELEKFLRDVNYEYFTVVNELEEFKNQRFKEFVAAKEVLKNVRNLLQIEQQCVLTPQGYAILDTWIPTADVEQFRKDLEKIFGKDVHLESTRVSRAVETGQGDKEKKTSRENQVPSLMKHNKIVSPFETLIQMYGVPNYKELDPTPLLVIFFPLFFGLMFGDVGHGIVLVIVGIVGYFKYKNSGSKSKINFGVILIYCGLGAILGGFLYGSYFGNPLVFNGDEFRLFVDPLSSSDAIIAVLKMCIILGVVHVNIGWLMQALNYVRTKKKYLALTDSGVKILLLSSGTFLIFTHGFDVMSWFSGSFPPILLVVIPALIFIIAKPLGKVLKIPYMRGETYGELIGEGSMQAFETFLSILSNIASYSRILALLVAHIGLMEVIKQAVTMIPFQGAGGLIFREIILIFGNAFVIMLESLLAFIQNMRLNFYEFFSKFYAGDGVPFSAMKIENSYSKIVFTQDYGYEMDQKNKITK